MSTTENTKLWGGRFSQEPHQTFFEFNRSFEFDQKLFFADIQGSLAHIENLKASKLLDPSEAQDLQNALVALQEDVRQNPKLLSDDHKSEDIHSFIEAHLIKQLGDLGKRVHTGRSRNDQVATALRIWLNNESSQTENLLREVALQLVEIAKEGIDVIIPGYTHLQRAQPILWAHWCHAYIEMLTRDLQRLAEIRKRILRLPLGSGALAGSSLVTSRESSLRFLQFKSLCKNSLDAVSDRDFVIEWMSFASICMVHLSRLAEDLILYTSSEFEFIELSDQVSSGSSLMPQKKNPDALELIRGKSGRIFGHLSGFLATMKGLPLAYNKDLQEDKEAIFDTVRTLQSCLANTSLILKNLKLKEDSISAKIRSGYMEATDLADLLVQKGVPFRTAHEKVGELVKLAISQKIHLPEMSEKQFQKVLPAEYFGLLKDISLENCIARKSGVGGTAREQVQKALSDAENFLKSN